MREGACSILCIGTHGLNFEHFFARTGNIKDLWSAMHTLQKKSGSNKWIGLEKIFAFFVRRYFLYGVRRVRARIKANRR